MEGDSRHSGPESQRLYYLNRLYLGEMNYQEQFSEFRRKIVQRKDIRRRWFRNYYVLCRHEGYTTRTFVLEAGKFDPNKYEGAYYGPFFLKVNADDFAEHLKFVYEDFALYGS